MFYIIESLWILVNINQYENNNLLDYVKKFKETLNVVKSQLGMDFLYTFYKQSIIIPNMYQTIRANKNEEGRSREMDGVHIDESYWPIQIRNTPQWIVSHFSLGFNQSPKTIMLATDVLSNHKLDPKLCENKKSSCYKARNDN